MPVTFFLSKIAGTLIVSIKHDVPKFMEYCEGGRGACQVEDDSLLVHQRGRRGQAVGAARRAVTEPWGDDARQATGGHRHDAQWLSAPTDTKPVSSIFVSKRSSSHLLRGELSRYSRPQIAGRGHGRMRQI
jgi:hypothetical protein